MDEGRITRDEFIRKWCDCKTPEKILEINKDLDILLGEKHYFEFSKDKPCNCQTCDPKPIFESK